MSIIVAVERNGEIALAADSQTQDGSGEIQQAPSKKVSPMGMAYIGHVGYSVMGNALEQYRKTHNQVSYCPRTTQDVYAFFLDFRQALINEYGLINENPFQDSQRSPFINWNEYFLTISPFGIYCTEGNLGTVQYTRFTAIGSGSQFALGYLEGLYNLDTQASAALLAEEACHIAIKYDIYCGGEVFAVSIQSQNNHKE